VSNSVAIAYQDENGRSCYLGGLYLANPGSYNTGGLRSGVEDQLLEQAVAWAGAGAPCLGLDVTQLIGGRNSTWDVSGAQPGTEVAVVFGFQRGETMVSGTFGYCATFGIDGVNPNRVICRTTADGNGEASCNRLIPNAAIGRRVLSQAAQRGSCPEECISRINDQVVR